MSLVILAEKPSQARDYAAAFKKTSTKDGYIEVEENFFNDKAYITWGFGHLVELVEPKEYKEEWGKWDLDSLPILPEKYKFQIPKDKKKQFNIVKKLLLSSSEIIVATDPDREGENIARSIINMAGASKIPTKRLWVNSTLPDRIRKAFTDLKDGNDFIGMYKEAQTRQISDWLIGMNLSRLYTLLLQQQGIHEVFSIGRVQTPTLYLIYQRQKEIENFVPKPFYEIFANIAVENGTIKAKYKERFDKPEDVKNLLAKHNISKTNEAVISEVTKEGKSTKAPSLYSLSTLQSKANKVWKYSPQKVLDTVQELYEKKLLTYPRTDTQHIGDGEFEYLLENIKGYQKIINCNFDIAYEEPRKKYVDGSKVLEHHAIIPTEKVPSEKEVEELNQMQKDIFFEVIRNTLAMFAPDYEYEETKITASINDLSFNASGKVETNKGWKVLFAQEAKEDTEKKDTANLPQVDKGEIGKAKLDVKQGKTTPPKPYTEGQLIDLMKTAGKSLEDDDEKEILKGTEGIGTEATRASIIETIKSQNYIEIVKNKVAVTTKGEILCKSIENTLLASPSMTANWEMYLEKVGKGKGTQENFLKNIRKLIEKMLNDAPQKINNDAQLNHTISSVKNDFKKPKKKKFSTRKKAKSSKK